MAYKYPNLAAEMARTGVDYQTVYEYAASITGKKAETIQNWMITDRNGEMPVKAAFAIRDKFFPELTIEYLFSESPITPFNCVPAMT